MSGNIELGVVISFLVFMIVHIKLQIEWNYHTYFTIIGYLLSLVAFAVVCILPNSIIVPYPLDSVTDQQNLYWVYFNMFNNITSWFLFLVTIFTAILPDLILKVFEEINFVNPCVSPYEKNPINTNSELSAKKNKPASTKFANPQKETRSLTSNVTQNIKNNTSDIKLENISDDENSAKNSINEYDNPSFTRESSKFKKQSGGNYYDTEVIETKNDFIFKTLV